MWQDTCDETMSAWSCCARAQANRGGRPSWDLRGHSRLERGARERGVVPLPHRPADQVARGQVDDRRQVQPAHLSGDVGQVAASGHVRPARVEQAPQQIPCRRRGRALFGQAAATVRAVPADAVDPHRPLDALAVDHPVAGGNHSDPRIQAILRWSVDPNVSIAGVVKQSPVESNDTCSLARSSTTQKRGVRREPLLL